MDASVVTPETMTAAATAATATAATLTAASSELVATAAPVVEVVEEGLKAGTREAMAIAAGLALFVKGALDGLKRWTELLSGNRLAKVLVVCAVLSVAVVALDQVALGSDIWNALIMAGGPFGAILVDQAVSSGGRRTKRDDALAYLNARAKESDKSNGD